MNKSYLNSEKNSTLSSKPSTSIRLLLMVLFVNKVSLPSSMKRHLLSIFLCLFFVNIGFAQSVGDYRSIKTGNWTETASWQYFNGTNWVTPSGTSPQGYPGQFTGTGNVTICNGNTITLTSTISNLFTKLIIGEGISGVFVVGANISDFNTLDIVINTGGIMSFTGHYEIKLPVNSGIKINAPGKIDASGKGDCTNNTAIYIGGVKFGVCKGAGNAEYTFDEINSFGGTLISAPSSNTPVCKGNSVNLLGSYLGPTPNTISYSWSIKAPDNSISSSNSQNYSFIALQSGNYQATLTCNALYDNRPYSNSETISITVNAGPAAPTGSSSQSFCSGATVANLSATGTAIKWYSAANGGSPLATSTALVNGTHYYASQTIGCESFSRLDVTATVTANTWTGTTSASWFTPSNWSCGSVPTAASDVIIPNETNKPVIDGTNTTALANTLTVNSGSLTVKSGNTLKVTDAVTNNSGTITFENSASLVQENDNAVNVGAIKYQRLTAPIRQTDYTYWSSPVKPIVGGGYLLGSIATSQNYLSYDSNITNDWKYENASTQMTNGFGYAIQGPSTMAGSPYLATFVGVPNNGNVQVPITYTSPSDLPSTDPDFGISYLLGNPYPSAIDADTFLSTNAGVLDGTLYFWTHNTEIGKGTTNLGSGAFAFTSNDYASYNYTGGVSGTGSAAESIGSSAIAKDIPTGKIAAGQGFFATGIASGTVNFINDMRISGTSLADGSGANQQFFKTKNPKAKTAKIEKNRVWLNLSNTQGAFKQTLIGYVTGATNENDTRFDGQSFDGHEFIDFYSINDGKNLTIQGRALPFAENDEVPLGYRTTITGEFTINIDQVDGSLTNQPVFLEDKLTHTVTDLKSGNYTFNTNAGTFDNRFVLRYKDHSSDKTLGLDETDANDGIIVLYSNNYKTLIIRNNGEATINSVSLFNMTGQNLSVWDIKDWEQTSIQIPIKESSSGIYVVKVKTTMGESSKKIVIR